jgi:hypothetical protein
MLLQVGRDYQILGWANVTYLGQEIMAGKLQHKFRRSDGLGVFCVTPDRLHQEVQLCRLEGGHKWQDQDKLVVRIQHLGVELDDHVSDSNL